VTDDMQDLFEEEVVDYLNDAERGITVFATTVGDALKDFGYLASDLGDAIAEIFDK
jgi:hypothetical protein